jgi:hypothetical protein
MTKGGLSSLCCLFALLGKRPEIIFMLVIMCDVWFGFEADELLILLWKEKE